MNLTTEVKNRVILFHDGSHKFITEDQELNIYQKQANGEKHFLLNGRMTSISSIARFVDSSEYYDNHPEERPEYRPEWKETPVEPYKSVQDQIQANEAMRSGVVKGLESEIISRKLRGESTANAEWILKQFKNKKKATIL